MVDAGDVLIAHIFWEGTTTAPSTPLGWTLLDGPRVIETTIARHWVFGKIADGTEDGTSITFALAPAVTTQRGARIYSFSGRVGGTITDLVVGFAATSHATDPQMPTVTTTVAGSLAVALVAQNDNNTIDSATGESGGDWVEAVAEFSANLTPGLLLQIQTAAMASVGTISGGTFNTANDPVGVIGFEIRPSLPAVTGTGAPASQAATASGTGVSASTGTGEPAAQSATVSGAGITASTGTGALAAQAAVAVGEGTVGSAEITGTGVLVASSATASGVGLSASLGTGAPAAQAASASGEGTVSGIGAAPETPAAPWQWTIPRRWRPPQRFSVEAPKPMDVRASLVAQAATVSGIGGVSGLGRRAKTLLILQL